MEIMNMAKVNTTATAVSTTATAVSINSLRDGAYRQAGATQTIETVAQYCIESVAGFPETISTEAKDELYGGYRMKFNELNPANTYAVVNGSYVTLETLGDQDVSKVEQVTIGVEFAYSYTNQEFGKLKDENPQLHSLIKIVREKCSTYCSNRLGDLKRAGRKLLNNGKDRERTANKSFDDYVNEWLKDTAPTRLKNAISRGNNSQSDTERFNKAVIAFRVVWNG
jgi:hypothetical protein